MHSKKTQNGDRDSKTAVKSSEDSIAEGNQDSHPETGRHISGGIVTKGMNYQLNILAGLGIIAFLYFAKTILIPIALAAVGAMVLKPVMKWLSRMHIPVFLSGLLILGFFLSLLAFGFVELSQPAAHWMNDAPTHVAQLRQRAEKFLPTDKIKKAADSLSQMPLQSTNKVPEIQVKDNSGAGKAINWTAGFLAGAIETVVLLYMFLVLGGAFLDKLLDGNEPAERKRALTIGREVQETISNYLLTVSIINVSLGTLVGAGLYFMGIPNAVLWGLMAALLNFIPYFGPIVGIIIVGVVSLLTFDTIPRILLPAGWYLVLHLSEADYITPVLLGQRFTVSPLVVFISLLFGIWVWGVIGALLSVPILISVKVLCQRVPSLAAGNRFL